MVVENIFSHHHHHKVDPKINSKPQINAKPQKQDFRRHQKL